MFRTSFALLAGLLTAGVTAAQPTFPFPAKAPVVVQVQGIERTQARLKAMLAAALPDDAAKINAGIDDGLKQLLKDRQLTAVPKDGRLFLVINDLTKITEDEPAVSVLVPVTGYKAFLDTFLTAAERKSYEKGQAGVDSIKSRPIEPEVTLYLVDLKDYVAVTIDKGTAEGYAKTYPKATAAELGAGIAASFAAADVALFVNMDVINSQFGEQIQQGRGLIDFALQQAGQGGMLPGVNKKQFEAVKVLVKGAFQGVEDARGVVLAFEFRTDGVAVRVQGRFAADSPSGKFLKEEKPGPLADLGNLPRGLTTYAGSAMGKQVGDIVRMLGGDFAGPEDDETSIAAIEKLQADLAAAGAKGEYSASSVPGTSLAVTTYENPAKAAAALTGLYQAVPAGGKILNVVLKDKPKVAVAARKHGGFTLTEAGLAFDFAATVKDIPEELRGATEATMRRLVRETMTVWVGTDGKRVVSLTAKDWAAAAKLLDEFAGGTVGVGGDAGFRLTRANLPKEASAISMIETAQFVRLMVDQLKGIADAIPGFPLQLGDIKPVKGEPTYLGLALTLKAETATADVFVPAAAVNVTARMLASLFKNIE